MNFKLLLTTVAVLALSAAAFGSVSSGGRYTTLEGGTVTFNATLHPIHNTTSCTVTDGQGTSGAAQGTPTPGGCGGSTDSSGEMTTDDGGTPAGNQKSYRVGTNKKMQQQNADGDWKNLKAAKGLQPTNSPEDDCEVSWNPPGYNDWSDIGIDDPFAGTEEGAGSGALPPLGDTVGSHPNRGNLR